MADIRPLRGWRYDPARAGNVEALLAPLTERTQTDPLRYRIYEHSVHLAAPRSIAQAADRLERWRQHGILRQDPLPTLYAYEQGFSLYGTAQRFVRRGFIALVRLNDARTGRGDIRYHEDVRPQPVAELVRLLHDTRLAITPAHGLYHDPAQRIEPLLATYLQAPVLDVQDALGVRHRLGFIHQQDDVRAIRSALATQAVLLADGHHRIAAAEAFRDACRAAAGAAWDDRALPNYALMYLSNAATGDARILPTHRVLHLPQLDEASVTARLSAYFDLLPLDRRTPLYQELRGEPGTFLLVMPGLRRKLRLKPQLDPLRDNPLPLPDSVKRLDYTALHYFALDQALGIPYAEQANDSRLEYVREFPRAVEAGGQPGHLALLCNEVRMPDFIAVTEARARMPAKSTYFFPKVLSGLVYASLDDESHTGPFDQTTDWT